MTSRCWRGLLCENKWHSVFQLLNQVVNQLWSWLTKEASLRCSLHLHWIMECLYNIRLFLAKNQSCKFAQVYRSWYSCWLLPCWYLIELLVHLDVFSVDECEGNLSYESYLLCFESRLFIVQNWLQEDRIVEMGGRRWNTTNQWRNQCNLWNTFCGLHLP